jgi:DNA-binding transcriptional MerR regulator
MSGLSARTLRYWEKCGLLIPLTRMGKKNKRVYKGGDVLLLQQIMLMKRSGMSLSDIKNKISIDRKENIKILLEQNKILKTEYENIQRILIVTSNTIQALRGQSVGHLSDNVMLSCFNKKQKSVQYRQLISIK